MSSAARVTDATAHGAPLGAGPGSANVSIGSLPAWRAIPTGPLQASLEAASAAANSLMSAALLSPPSAAAPLAELTKSLGQSGIDAAIAGNDAAVSAAGSAVSAINSANATLTNVWLIASTTPGGLPAAAQAYTKALQATIATAASSFFATLSGMTDLHTCPAPCPAGPHGPGVVTQASKTVQINSRPAARKGDNVIEACGGADPIQTGLATVSIGD